jgi:mycothiol system anti-sigma-R factor
MSRLTCEESLELLMDFLKRELPPEIAASVEKHLNECKPCERHARFETRFVFLIEKRLGRAPCPEQVKARILESLAQEQLE